jgi:cysteine synthase
MYVFFLIGYGYLHAGTLTGVAESLRELSDRRVKIALTDPPGAKLFRYYTTGKSVQTNNLSRCSTPSDLTILYSFIFCYDVVL